MQSLLWCAKVFWMKVRRFPPSDSCRITDMGGAASVTCDADGRVIGLNHEGDCFTPNTPHRSAQKRYVTPVFLVGVLS